MPPSPHPFTRRLPLRLAAAAAFACLTATAAWPQGASAPAARPGKATVPAAGGERDPLAPTAAPTPTPRSSLASYRRIGEPEPTPWRQANDEVARIGGWRAYAREAASAAAAASAASPAVRSRP